MKTVYKYNLPVVDRVIEVPMPEGAELLCVDSNERSSISLWAKVDTSLPMHSRRFLVYGTGHPLTSSVNSIYVGTAFDLTMSLVWHVFEVPA